MCSITSSSVFSFLSHLMEKLFNDLESLIPQEQETAKRELAECFATSKLEFAVQGFISQIFPIANDERFGANFVTFAV